MAFYPGSFAPPSVPAGTPKFNAAARAQRVNQAQHLEERLRNGISQVAVAGMAAVVAQLETQQVLPSIYFYMTGLQPSLGLVKTTSLSKRHP